jgi:hypothetical protein
VGLTKSVLFLEIGDPFGVLRGFEFFKPIDPIIDLFTMFLLDCGKKLASITIS